MVTFMVNFIMYVIYILVDITKIGATWKFNTIICLSSISKSTGKVEKAVYMYKVDTGQSAQTLTISKNMFVQHFYNFYTIFDFGGVSESQNGCAEHRLLKLTITLTVYL